MSHIYIYTHLYTWQWELHLQHEVSTHAGILILPTCPSLQVGPHPLMPRNCFRNAMLPLISWYWWPGCENGEMVCLCLWRGLIVQALHSCTPWTAIYIYIYIHTFLPNAYAFLFLFTSSFMTWTFTFLVAMLVMIPASGRALQQQQRPRRHHQAYRSTTFRFSVAWLR